MAALLNPAAAVESERPVCYKASAFFITVSLTEAEKSLNLPP